MGGLVHAEGAVQTIGSVRMVNLIDWLAFVTPDEPKVEP